MALMKKTPSPKPLILALVPVLIMLCAASALHAGMQKGKTDIPAGIDAVLAGLPAENAEALDARAGRLLALGPSGIEELCRRLSPAGTADDSRARYAVNAMTIYVGKPGRENDRRMFVEAILRAARAARDTGIKTFLISQSTLAGRNEAVKPLAAFLKEESTAGPAARALRSIGGPEAGKALLNALGGARGKALVDIIQAAGELQPRGTVKTVLRFASSDDPTVRQATLKALSLSGDPAAGPALAMSRIAAPVIERRTSAALYLAYARKLAEKGGRATALEAAWSIYRAYRNPGETHIAADALELIVSLLPEEKAADALLEAMDGDDAELTAAALELTFRFGAERIVPLLIAKAGAAGTTPSTKAMIIDRLGRRGEKAALPLVRSSLADSDPEVCLAAIAAANGPWAEELLPALIGLAVGTDDAAELTAIKRSLLCFREEAVSPPAAAAEQSAPVPARAMLLEVLGEKGASGRTELVFSETRSEQPEVRTAALKALAGTAGPSDLRRIIDLLALSSSSGDIRALEDAAAAAAGRDADRDTAVGRLLAMFDGSIEPGRIAIIRLMPRLGGAKALDFLRAELKDSDPPSRTAALVALSRWPDSEAADDLLQIIKTTGAKRELLMALEGHVRLIKGSKDPAWKKYELLKAAAFSLKEDQEKAVVIRGLAELRDPWSLKLLSFFLDHPVLGPAAANSILEIASEQSPDERWLSGHQAVSILRRIEDTTGDPEEKGRVRALIGERLKQGGFVELFDGRGLDGWKGLVADPPKRAAMDRDRLAAAQAEADARMRSHWKIEDGILVFDGKGESLCTARDYADFELLVDWKIEKDGDSGIYLRGAPQVQIWDPAANPVGSGGLYNNQKGADKPLEKADRPAGEWNSFRIIMIGDKVTVYLNDKLVVDNTVMENYWERDKPIYPEGQIELQSHGSILRFRNIWVREIPRDAAGTAELDEFERTDGYRPLFNGRDLEGWTGGKEGYAIEDGRIVVIPEKNAGNLYTENEFTDFSLRFEFKPYPAANNGIGVRAPLEGDAAYAGMEVQVLEDGSPIYWDLRPYQYHGSVYGTIPARRGVLNPPGLWNTEEITVRGRRVRVIVNGTVIVDGDLDQASASGTIDGREHPGLARTSGHIGFLGHGSRVEFRNIRIKELK